jgi:hypothetical protein
MGSGEASGYRAEVWREPAGQRPRPSLRTLQATEEEAARPLPGDAVVEKADFVATRAITIKAPSHDVWPWLMQTGSGRAGWYTYDRFDNAGVPSATQILPELQQLAGGDLIPMVVGRTSGSTYIGVHVKELEPSRRMLWWDEKASTPGSWSRPTSTPLGRL